MFEINKRNARMWSRIGARAFYGQAISALAQQNDNIIALSADLGRSSGLSRFADDHPDQFINTGIAEQNLVGFSAGLARMGFDVFSSTFAPFASLRAGEQVRMNMGYMHEPVKLVALGSGLAMAFLGNSHYGLEDVAVMRTVPDLTIISPADCAEIYKTLHACVGFPHPVYIRLTGAIGLPVVYEDDYDFRIGRGVWLRPAQDVTLVAAGSTVGHCLKAAAELEEQGLSVGLLNMHTIKPLDAEAIVACVGTARQIYVIDEHTRIGGLGSAVLDHINEHHWDYQGRVFIHGIDDRYVETGSYPFLLERNGLDAAGIAAFVRQRTEAA
ncbi:transketolase family protein [Ruegeria arenilitoris]|uniref:transketolase family protein n=1 Tax=Ruegeria arenilitoris TaxID=1173585 RepID=UPI001C97C001|nr:transketolase C-terminal domain-containing protein [Ruegeria arenilitoris]MBY6081862.1 transketolase family protein [Ruegeria arenilitoris]